MDWSREEEGSESQLQVRGDHGSDTVREVGAKLANTHQPASSNRTPCNNGHVP